MKNKGLSESEAIILGNLLRKAKFPLPRAAFDGWVENLPHVALELAIIRITKGHPEVFMIKRGPDDKFWPNEWNMPGTIVRQNEILYKAYKRLLSSEMFLDGKGSSDAAFIDYCQFPTGGNTNQCRRGHEIGLLHFVLFTGSKLKGGKFFSIDKLPQNTVPHHRYMVTRLKKFYQEILQSVLIGSRAREYTKNLLLTK